MITKFLLGFVLSLSVSLTVWFVLQAEAAYTFNPACPHLTMPAPYEVNGSSLVGVSQAAFAEWDINPGEEVIAVSDGHGGYVYINRVLNSVSSTYIGTTTRGAVSGDGHNVIAYGPLPLGQLGQTNCVQVDGQTVEFDIIISNSAVFGGKNGYSLQRDIEHELGHAMGLGHSTSGGCGGIYRPLMCFSAAKNSLIYVMQEDSEGIASLYP